MRFVLATPPALCTDPPERRSPRSECYPVAGGAPGVCDDLARDHLERLCIRRARARSTRSGPARDPEAHDAGDAAPWRLAADQWDGSPDRGGRAHVGDDVRFAEGPGSLARPSTRPS